MADEKTEQVKVFFDGYASDFDGIYGHDVRRGPLGRWIDRNLRKAMFLRFQEVLSCTERPSIRSILDIGCGPGHYCAALAKQGKTVVGLDIAEGMLRLAEAAVARAGVPDKVSFVRADYLEQQFSQTFDAACLMGFFDYIENPLPILAKLKKDVSVEFYASFPRKDGFLALQRRFRYWLRNCPLHLYSHSEITSLLQEAGLARYELLDLGRDYFVKVYLNK